MYRVKKRRREHADRLSSVALGCFDRRQYLVFVSHPLHRKTNAAQLDIGFDGLKIFRDDYSLIRENGDMPHPRHQINEDLEPLAIELRCKKADPSKIAAGSSQRGHQSCGEI